MSIHDILVFSEIAYRDNNARQHAYHEYLSKPKIKKISDCCPDKDGNA
jgi:hypothetical protein